MKNDKDKKKHVRRHLFHIVDPSPWPFLTGIIVLTLFTSAVMYMHNYKYGGMGLIFSFISLIAVMFIWWKDVIREGTFEGNHTKVVQNGFKNGYVTFYSFRNYVFSLHFFWAFFHASISPSIEIGIDWPPAVINVLDPFSIPLLNTIILLTSGFTVTWAHHAVKGGSKKEAQQGLLLTILLGIFFTALQGFEYVTAPFWYDWWCLWFLLFIWQQVFMDFM